MPRLKLEKTGCARDKKVHLLAQSGLGRLNAFDQHTVGALSINACSRRLDKLTQLTQTKVGFLQRDAL